MAASAGSGLGLGTLAAGVAVAAVVGVVGYQIVFVPDTDPAPDAAAPQGIAADAGTDRAADALATPAETGGPEAPDLAADPVTPPGPVPPSFDLVRVDAAGGALIAGQAEGNAALRLRLDGQEIYLANSDAGGDFVAMFDIPPSELPRVLSLEMLMEDGSVLVSEQSVIISPTLRAPTGTDGTEIAATEAAGPDLHSDSGVSDLAMASEPDSPPAGGVVPVTPLATPELPEAGGVAATGDAGPTPDATSPALAGRAPDSAPDGAPDSTVAGTPALGAQDAAPAAAGDAGPVLEVAAVEPEGGEGQTRGLQGHAPDGAEAGPSEAAAEQTGNNSAPAAAPPDALADGAAPEAAADPSDGDQAEGSNPAVVQLTEGTAPEEGQGTAPESVPVPTAAEVAAEDAQTPVPAEDAASMTQTASVAEPSGGPDAGGAANTTDEVTQLALAEGADSAAAPPASGAAPEVSAESGALAMAEGADSAAAPPASGAAPEVSADGGALAMAEGADSAVAPPASGTAAASSEGNALPDTGADSPSQSGPDSPAMEPQAPTILLADSQGIRVIQSGDAAPQVQARVTLDTIGYDTEGDVILAGRGRAESDVRFYLDNQPIHLAPIDLQGGWRTALPQVDPGTYTLRLDEVSADGAVQSRIETPFLREEPETVAAITARTGENVITVQWGNTLWGIAQQHLGEGVAYVQIYEANRDQIRDPDLIYPGQIFTLPEQDQAQDQN